MRLYWNEEYPDCLYCLGYNSFTQTRALYVLSDVNFEEVDPATGEPTQTSNMKWQQTQWPNSEKELLELDFEYIGSI